MEEEKFIQLLRESDTLEEKEKFKINAKINKSPEMSEEEKREYDKHYPILIDKNGRTVRRIFIRKTHDVELDKYKFKSIENYLFNHNVKLSDVEVTNISNGIMINGKKKQNLNVFETII